MASKYFVTTPIFYVNSVPHIGHMYTAVLADAISRWKCIQGKQVLFTTGTDEHGLKIQQAAVNAKQTPEEFCTRISSEFKKLFSTANIGYTDYIRTTEQRHKNAVVHFWNTLYKNGYIYRGSYEGWYSISDEAFLSPDQVTKQTASDGSEVMISLESGHIVEWIKEDNYMFRLSAFNEKISSWLNHKVIKPSVMEASLRPFVDKGLHDLSVSRQRSRLRWGIPVPGDDSQTIYVWLDALVNYLTVAGYPHHNFNWPPDCQLVGKDILRFHAVYWPAMLMAAGLEPPKCILSHSHWTVDNFKMSKSKGNVVDPIDQIKKFSSDGLRYFLLREGVPHSDGNYSEHKVVDYVNSDLVNTLGNLLNRVTGTVINPTQTFPQFHDKIFASQATDDDKTMLVSLFNLPKQVNNFYEDFHFYKGLEAIMSQLHATNAFVQYHKPWVLAKSLNTEDLYWLQTIIAVALETLRVSAILLQPVTPIMADKLLSRLNILPRERTWNHLIQSRLNNCNKLSNLGERTGILMARVTGS